MIVHWKDQKMSQKHVHASSINLCISEFDHFFSFSIWPWPIWLCWFRCECCFDSKQRIWYPGEQTSSEAAMHVSILIPKTFKQLASWKNWLAMKFEQAQISRKASRQGHHKPSQELVLGSQTARHKHACGTSRKNLRCLAFSFEQWVRVSIVWLGSVFLFR